MKKGATINKILEIDMDTNRNIQVEVRQLSSTDRKRNRAPDASYDLKDNAVILLHALLGCVLQLEKAGIDPPGEGIRKAIAKLEQGYVDATAEVCEIVVDKKGTITHKTF